MVEGTVRFFLPQMNRLAMLIKFYEEKFLVDSKQSRNTLYCLAVGCEVGHAKTSFKMKHVAFLVVLNKGRTVKIR